MSKWLIEERRQLYSLLCHYVRLLYSVTSPSSLPPFFLSFFLAFFSFFFHPILACSNANTRYLHHLRVLLAARLLSTFPSPLGPDQGDIKDMKEGRGGKVFFVNSGSEANDLALRLARAHTGGTDVIVAERAYHGHTSATIEISPYKFDHPR